MASILKPDEKIKLGVKMPQSTINLLENFADYCALKNKIIAQNIANVGTENYQRQDVVFKDVLNENINAQLKATEAKHIGAGSLAAVPEYQVITDASRSDTSGVNNVDIDKEMSELAVNNLNYQFAAKKIGDYFKNIQMVIKGAVG